MIDYTQLDEHQKRKLVHDICHSINVKVVDVGYICLCPFEKDPGSWCRKYSSKNVDADKLDSILKTFSEAEYLESIISKIGKGLEITSRIIIM